MGERWSGHPEGGAAEVLNLDRYFAGNFSTEEESVAAFDAIVERSDLFRVYKEVPGHYMASRPGREQRSARIDRLLVPGPRLRAGGWNITFGVEAKRSGERIGHAIAQALDYTWCVFHANATTYLYPEWIFLWPLPTQFHAVASVMAQNRIGEANERGGRIAFGTNGTGLLSIGADGTFECQPERADRVGHKKGSR